MQCKDLQAEITSLQFQLVHHEQMLKNAMQHNVEFAESTKIYQKIKKINSRLEEISQIKWTKH
jgi:hypothetical protein